MILIQQSYSSPDPSRQAELDFVRNTNASCSAFTEIVRVEGQEKRYSFSDLFAIAESRFCGKPCVLANSDIAFDCTINDLLPILRPSMLVALTRWDDATAPSMEGRIDERHWKFFSHSQDTWVFLAGTLPQFKADFQLGIPRCENRLAYEAAAAGVIVANPALSVRTWHHHATNVRTWKKQEYYRGSLYFPRMTTLLNWVAEGFVVHKTNGRREAVVRLDGSAGSFAEQMAAGFAPCFPTRFLTGMGARFFRRKNG